MEHVGGSSKLSCAPLTISSDQTQYCIGMYRSLCSSFRLVIDLVALSSLSSLHITLLQHVYTTDCSGKNQFRFDSNRFRAPFILWLLYKIKIIVTTEPAPISKITWTHDCNFNWSKNADGVKGLLCSIYRQVSKHGKALSVGDNLLLPWSLPTFHSHAYLLVPSPVPGGCPLVSSTK